MTEQPEQNPPMPNREPVREGVREIEQDPDLFADDEADEASD